MADPHELANVLGVEGIEYVLKTDEVSAALSVYVMLPSCVRRRIWKRQAARDWKTIGFAALSGQPVECWGLAEMMN